MTTLILAECKAHGKIVTYDRPEGAPMPEVYELNAALREASFCNIDHVWYCRTCAGKKLDAMARRRAVEGEKPR